MRDTILVSETGSLALPKTTRQYHLLLLVSVVFHNYSINNLVWSVRTLELVYDVDRRASEVGKGTKRFPNHFLHRGGTGAKCQQYAINTRDSFAVGSVIVNHSFTEWMFPMGQVIVQPGSILQQALTKSACVFLIEAQLKLRQ